MPREMSSLDLARLSREGRARYEDDGKGVPAPRKEASDMQAMCQAIISGMEGVASQLAQQNAQQASAMAAQVREIANAARTLAAAERKDREEPEYEFTVTERDNLGRPKKMLAKPLRR